MEKTMSKRLSTIQVLERRIQNLEQQKEHARTRYDNQIKEIRDAIKAIAAKFTPVNDNKTGAKK